MNVVKLFDTSLLDVPNQLRALADCIEQGHHGDNVSAFVVIPEGRDGAVGVFGYGPNSSFADAFLAFNLGAQHFLNNRVSR